jgi:hypothetical protein
LGNLGVAGRVILKWVLKTQDVDWIQVAEGMVLQLRLKFEFHKSMELLDQMSKYDSAPRN